MKTPPIGLYIALLLGLATSLVAQSAPRTDPEFIWRLTEPATTIDPAAARAEPWIQASRYQLADLAPQTLDALLEQAPLQGAHAGRGAPLILHLPTPHGEFDAFEIVESPVMAPGLAEWFTARGHPMRTFKGRGLAHPERTLRLDWGGPAGLHGMVSAPDGEGYFLDPAQRGRIDRYISYRRQDFDPQGKTLSCGSPDPVRSIASRTIASSTDPGEMLRTYRTAVAATAEYTAFQDANSSADRNTDAMAAIVTTINRVDEIYERDLSLRLVLVDDNHKLIFTDPATDPYTNKNAAAMLYENQSTLDAVIGSANYDLGHVFGFASGGLAALDSSCDNRNKAQGATGSTAPKGDPFDIDYVAHEIAHQLGGDHTFNAITGGACTWGARNAATAYEPGSGSTILSYSGICGNNNLQLHSDAYFHNASLQQIVQHLNNAGACTAESPSGNQHAPTVNAGQDYIIPASTPFRLSPDSAADADNDPLTYNWEQFDLGAPRSLAEGDDAMGPLIRSRGPSGNPVRHIPRLEDLAAGRLPAGVLLPSTNRTLNFRVSVRDNHSGGGRVGHDTLTVAVDNSGGPFRTTAPNGGEDLNAVTQPQTPVTWNPAATPYAPIGVAEVAILLSTDGGLSFPHTLVAATPNDGSEVINLPKTLSTTQGRIMVQALGNLFFDISDNDFSLNAPTRCSSPNLVVENNGAESDTITFTDLDQVLDLVVELDADFNLIGDMSVRLEHLDSGRSALLIDRLGHTDSDWGCADGTLRITLDDAADSSVESACTAGYSAALSGPYRPNEALAVFDDTPLAGAWRLTLSDATDLTFADTPDTLLRSWCITAVKKIIPEPHRLEVDTDGLGRGSVIADSGGIQCPNACTAGYAADTTVRLTATPEPGSVFIGWSGACVTGKSVCTLSMDQARSVTATFEPTGEHCSTAPLALTDNGTVSQEILADTPGLLSDLNVYLKIEHSWVGDLTATLKNTVTGQSVVLIQRPGRPADATGCAGDDIDATLDDEASAPAADACNLNSPAILGPLTPNTPLDVFDHQAYAGAWRLTISDAVNEDTGRLVQWCLQGDVYPRSSTYPLGITVQGNGSVAATRGALTCPGACTAEYATDSPVTLTATPKPGSKFFAWSGDCTGSAPACTLVMGYPKNATAVFTDLPADTQCTTDNLLVSQSFTTGIHRRRSETRITTTAPVRVTGDATLLILQAPEIRLTPGFSVQAGSGFYASAEAVQCDSN